MSESRRDRGRTLMRRYPSTSVWLSIITLIVLTDLILSVLHSI